MSDREPKRTWTQAQIGTVERANPLARLAGGIDVIGARIIEAGIIFKHATQFDVKAEVRMICPMTAEEQEARARKALWRYVHDGLDDPLFEILMNIRRAHTGLSPIDPARLYLHEAAARLQVLIDHVLGNERPTGPDGWADVELPESLKSRTQE